VLDGSDEDRPEYPFAVVIHSKKLQAVVALIGRSSGLNEWSSYSFVDTSSSRLVGEVTRDYVCEPPWMQNGPSHRR
jgi:hypothetical protein